LRLETADLAAAADEAVEPANLMMTELARAAPPPIPVPSVSSTKFSVPAPMPKACSPRVAQRASLATKTGTSKASRRRKPRGASCQPKFGE
jgi:hypothetical protein